MPTPVEIFLIEDNPADADLTCEALAESTMVIRVTVAVDGVEALRLLRREGEYADVPRPGIILLDLNLPKKNGREVLAEIKSDPDLRGVPVVILSSSEAEEDIRFAYDLHANCYVAKSFDLNHFMASVKAIEKFWLLHVKLPG